METLYSNQNQSITCPSSPNNSEQMISRYFHSRIRRPSAAMLMEKRLIFCIIIGEGDSNMDEMMMYGKRIPEYYDTMYLDGYTPYEILYATRKKMFREYQEREKAKQDAIIPTINFKSVVKIIK